MLGVEVTGIVVAIGTTVSRFKPGDVVIATCGMGMGAHAEYVVIPECGAVVPRPDEMPIETAAALGFGGLTSRDFLRRANLQPDESVLVIGATGTVGSALIQLAVAVAAGAGVTAVCSAANLATAKKLGAAETIDYRACDLSRSTTKYDIVADTVGSLSFARALPMLADGGRFSVRLHAKRCVDWCE